MQGFYEFYIDVLMRLDKQRPRQGLDGEALQASESGRARSLLELLTEAHADIRQGVDPKLLEGERSLQQLLNGKAERQMRLLSGAHTEEQAVEAAKEIAVLETEYQQVEGKIRATSPRYAALTQPQPLTAEQIQQLLDKETLMLEYSLGDERSYLWAVSQAGIASFELAKREVIEAAARRFYDRLTARNKRVNGETNEQRQVRVAHADADVSAASEALSKLILGPVSTELGTKRLVIVADGALQYIPFGALPAVPTQISAESGGRPGNQSPTPTPQPLIVEHEVVTLPSASTLSVIRREVAGRQPAPKTIVALADPVFMKDDERVTRGANRGKNSRNTQESNPATNSVKPENGKDLQLVEAAQETGLASGGLEVPRLPGSRKEAERIIAMVPKSESKLVLDFAASRKTATSPDLSQYRYVHFSTHGFLNSVHPELSGIVLSLVNERGESQDGFLRAHEIFNLKLPAELVVLSACQTGIGREVKGEGMVSLTRGFMYAGAPRVVVSLWSVSDLGTEKLMVRFYHELMKEGKPPGAALRAAQLSLMTDKDKRWAEPFYWAPFIVQGDWR